ncbi:uncharacterized protein DEA37_0002210, partial [Paragonimus westermani]
FVAFVAVVYALPPWNVSPHFSVGSNVDSSVIDDNELKKELLVAVSLEKAAQNAAAEADLFYSKAKAVMTHVMEKMRSSTINANSPQLPNSNRVYRRQLNIEFPKSQTRLSDPLLEYDDFFSRPIFSHMKIVSHSKLLTAPAFSTEHEQNAMEIEPSSLEPARVSFLQKLLHHQTGLNRGNRMKHLRSHYSQSKFEKLLDKYNGHEFDTSDLLDTNLTPAEYLDGMQYLKQSESNADPLVDGQVL